MAASRPQYASTSLYVGDLSPEVAETTLYEFFNSVGPVASIRVCRDSGTRRSLGYAYVNYHNIADAERALDTLNFTAIRNRPCRIMWSQRDPTVRKTGAGNLFVKNLDKTVDNRALHDTFSLFGNILSCKVVTDENGKSKGYGFVHFESDEAAANAVERVNGMKIGSKEVFVGPFHKRNERSSGKPEHYTNIYVRSFPRSWTEDKLRSVFCTFGEITSLWLNADKSGRPFACINFQDGTHARNAVQTLNGRKCNQDGLIDETQSTSPEKQDNQPADAPSATTTDNNNDDVYTLFVDRAQDKAERGSHLKQRFDYRQQQYRQKFEGVNLYIKNLSDSVDDTQLRQMFEKFGTITSVKVMRDEESHSKGFGFVCFTSAEEATKAISEMHLKVHEQKPLYVGLAEQKDRRHARLQHHFRGNNRPPPSGPLAYGSGPNSMFYGNPNMMAAPPQAAQQHPGAPLVWPAPPPYPQQGPANVIWKAPPPLFGGPMAPTLGPNGPIPSHLMFPQAAGLRAPPPQAAPRNPTAMMRTSDGAPAGLAGGPPPMAAATPPPPQPVRTQQQTASQTAAMHKQVLGERLFPLVSKHQPALAGKITGMMLDMDDNELLMLISSETELKAKIDEALRVLEQAHLG